MRKLILTLTLLLLALPCQAQEMVSRLSVGTLGGGVAAACANDCTGNKGNTFTDGTPQDTYSFRTWVTKVTISGCSEANPTIHAYALDNDLGTVSKMKFIIYSDNAGEPNALLWSGSLITLDDTSYKDYSEATTVACMTGAYWIGAVTDTSITGFIQYKNTSQGGTRYFDDADTTPPETWPVDTDTASTNDRSFYLSF